MSGTATTRLTVSVSASVGALLTSTATLVCCVLPAMMVALGAGATLAGWVSTAPQLVWLSERKGWVFGIAAAVLTLSAALLWHARRLPCPADPAAAGACQRLRRLSHVLFAVAASAYVVGAVFAFVLPAFTN